MIYYNLCGIGSQHSNISKGKKRGGTYIFCIKKSLVCKTPIVKVDRNKNVTLNSVFTKFGQGNFRGVAKECFD